MSSQSAPEEPSGLPRRGLPSLAAIDLFGPRGLRALATALALFAGLVLVLFVQPLRVLPGYPAVILAFLIWAILPAWPLQRALFRTRATGLVEQASIAFLFSMALAALPGVAALYFHWGLYTFGVVFALVAAGASALALLFESELERPGPPAEESSFATGPLLLLVAMPLLAIATSPWWTDTVARDADDWVYLAYVNEYVESGMDVSAVQAGTGAFQRMRANVWVVEQALIAENADVAPHSLLLHYLPPIMTLLAAGATFTLAKGLFGRSSLALLTVTFLLGYAALDLSPHEGFGRNLFLRIAEDKMAAAFVLLPAGLLLTSRYIVRPGTAALLASVLAGLALFVVHPMGLMFLGLGVAAFAALRAIVERSPRTLIAGVTLLAPLALLGLIAAAYLAEESQAVAAAYDPRLLFRDQFRISDVGGGFSIGDYHLILHPLVLASLAIAPILWWRDRRHPGTQLMLAVSGGVVVAFFVPPLATAMDDWLSSNAVWRLPWMLPVALVLALACEQALEALTNRRVAGRLLGSAAGRSGTLAGAAILILAGALVVQETYVAADDGAFYNRTSSTSLLPGTEQSIVLGGVDRAFSSDWRLPVGVGRLGNFLNETLPPGSVVLADPFASTYLPGLLHDLDVVGSLGSATPEEAQLSAAFYGGQWDDLDGARQLARAGGADYVVASTASRETDALRLLATYAADQFRVREGSPEIIRIGAAQVEAWAFDPDSNELIALRSPIELPATATAGGGGLGFEVLLSPSEDVSQARTVRLVISYFEVVPSDQESEIINAVFDVELAAGTRAGDAVRARRSPDATLTPGASYGLVITRLAAEPGDTYERDLLFALASVTYFPEGVTPIAGSPFFVVDVGP